MVASANIKTPTLSLPFLKGVSQKDKDNVRIQMNKVKLLSEKKVSWSIFIFFTKMLIIIFHKLNSTLEKDSFEIYYLFLAQKSKE